MVWIHGGSLIVYGARDPDTDGASLAERQDVVVVTIQYRLGLFGFLHLAEVEGPGYEQSGNLGFLDQVPALGWVRDNIAVFGGDPDNVTIFRQSSGADSVSTLMCMTQAHGLFHRAIMQSGCPVLCAQAERASGIARHVMDLAGASTVEELQAMPMEQLLEVQAGCSLPTARTTPSFPWWTGSRSRRRPSKPSPTGSRRLIQRTWAQFARTGDPNHEGLPTWPSYALPRRPTMVFDVESKVEDDPLSEERRAWETFPFDGRSPTLEALDTLRLARE